LLSEIIQKLVMLFFIMTGISIALAINLLLWDSVINHLNKL
jgi:hypothetical protein